MSEKQRFVEFKVAGKSNPMLRDCTIDGYYQGIYMFNGETILNGDKVNEDGIIFVDDAGDMVALRVSAAIDDIEIKAT